jgi:acetyl esterase/lipase
MLRGGLRHHAAARVIAARGSAILGSTLVLAFAAAGEDSARAAGVADSDYRDITCPASDVPRAALVYLHGGAFLVGGTDDWLREHCEPFARAGFLTTAVDYPIRELGPSPSRFSYRRALRRVLRAVRRLRATDLPVFAYGESAGGNLAEMLAVRGHVAGAVAVAAPADLLTWAADNRVYWRFLGMSRAERRRSSPLYRIGPRPRPLLLLHSPSDDVVPLGQSRRLARALPNAKLIHLSGGHLEDPGAVRVALRWLRRRTQDPPPTRAGDRADFSRQRRPLLWAGPRMG